MSRKEQKTEMALRQDKRRWFVFDASNKTLGRFASEVSKVLRGKHRPDFCFHWDLGDGVIILNAEKVRLTGSKKVQKVYRYHTGYPRGMREVPFEVMQAKKPAYILEHAIWGMMPKTKLSKKQMKRLRIFAGSDHDMQAQQPVEVDL